MGKLAPIDGKQTQWLGLWWHPEYNGFSSEAISLADLRKYKGKVRLYIRKNKYFNEGENGQPNYRFTLRYSDAAVFQEVAVDDFEESKLITKKQLQEVINSVACRVGGDIWYGECLVEDYFDWNNA